MLIGGEMSKQTLNLHYIDKSNRSGTVLRRGSNVL